MKDCFEGSLDCYTVFNDIDNAKSLSSLNALLLGRKILVWVCSRSVLVMPIELATIGEIRLLSIIDSRLSIKDRKQFINHINKLNAAIKKRQTRYLTMKKQNLHINQILSCRIYKTTQQQQLGLFTTNTGFIHE